MHTELTNPCHFGQTALTIEDVVDLAHRRRQAMLSPDPAFSRRIQAGADFVDELLRREDA